MTHPAGTSAERPLRLGSATDAQVWRVATSEDPEAFGLIFDRHADAVHRYCARRSGSADAADDVVAIVFLEAWRKRGEVVLRHESALPWLLGVARHTLSHRARSRLRHQRAVDRLPRTWAPDHADGVVAQLDDRRRLGEVERAFATLGSADQDVIALCVWQGLEYAEAALSLGVPVGTVRSRLSRARARLAASTDQTRPEAGSQPGPKDT